MKKKLFLIGAIVAALVCLFAIGASAEEVTPPTRSTIQVLESDIVVFDDGFSCPSAYIVKDQTDLAFDFTYTEALGKSYNVSNIIELDIPEGIVSVGTRMFSKNTTLVRASIPKTAVTLGSCIFEFASALEKCTFEHTADSTLTRLPHFMFAYCSSLKAMSLPDCIEYISPVNAGDLYNSSFSNCTSLKALYLPRGLKTLKGDSQNAAVFAACTNLYFVDKPFDFTSDADIPAKPTVYYFPENLEYIKGETFKNCTSLNEYLVFGEKITDLSATATIPWAFNGCGNTSTIIFLGDMTGIACQWWNVKAIYCCNEKDIDATSANVINGSSRTIYYCNAQGNTNHLYLLEKNEAPTCTKDGVSGTACFCGKPSTASTVIKAQHDYGKTPVAEGWVWENDNYFANAKYKHTCQVCAEKYTGAEIENSYLFVKEGFATFENKDGEAVKSYDFQYSIKVNTDAMDDYTEATGKVINYGTVAGVGDSLTNPLSYENGTLSVGESAAVSDMTGTDYVKLLIKVTSIPVLEEGVKITCNAYAIVDDKLRYVGETTVTENAQFSVIK